MTYSPDSHRQAGAAIADRTFADVGGQTATQEEANWVFLKAKHVMAEGILALHRKEGIADPLEHMMAFSYALEGFSRRAAELASQPRPSTSGDAN